MSVTNDPNYHEGQPVFGPTDAVRPTGETGATCPWCGGEIVTHPCVVDPPEKRTWSFECPNEEGCPSFMDYPSPESALAAAARPLPDFPAGVPGSSLSEIMTWWGPSSDIPPQRTLELVRKVNEWWVVNAPDRPAAAGLTLTDAEREACIDVGVKAMFKEVDDDADETYIVALDSPMEGLRAALAHAESLLSSRATGAEVEIVIEDPTALEMMDLVRDCMPRAETGERAELKMSCIRTGIRKGIDFARRHATMRTGGGE